MSSLRDQIISAIDCKPTPIEIPEWGVTAYLKPLTAAETEPIQRWIIKQKDDIPFFELAAREAVASLCDESGVRLFTDDDVAVIKGKSAAALRRVHKAFDEINGLTSKGQEEIEKNSPTTG